MTAPCLECFYGFLLLTEWNPNPFHSLQGPSASSLSTSSYVPPMTLIPSHFDPVILVFLFLEGTKIDSTLELLFLSLQGVLFLHICSR